MTLTLHLGVVDIPYSVEAPRRVRVKFRKGQKPVASTAPAQGAQTTGDVAEWLEDRYHIMGFFFENHEKEVVEAIEEGLADVLESLMHGAPSTIDPFGAGTQDIGTAFKHFLDSNEMAGAVPGVPTQAAQDGVNHRLKIKRGAPRTSFIDTGTYQNAFLAWID